MEYEGYKTKQEILELIEANFPFIEKPPEAELYIFDENDLMRRIIDKNIAMYTSPELPYEGIMTLYDEFSTISRKTVEWLFPSMLRVILKGQDNSGNLHWYLPTYFENMNLNSKASAYDFYWLNKEQIKSLNCMLEFLSEEYGDDVGLAQNNLDVLYQKI